MRINPRYLLICQKCKADIRVNSFDVEKKVRFKKGKPICEKCYNNQLNGGVKMVEVKIEEVKKLIEESKEKLDEAVKLIEEGEE